MAPDYHLEKYKILVEHLRHHDRQIWALLAFLTAVNAFLFYILSSDFNYKFILPILGITLSLIWISGCLRSKVYTDSIHEQLRYLESKKLKESEDMNEYLTKSEKEKAKEKFQDFGIFMTFAKLLDKKPRWQKGGAKDLMFFVFPVLLALFWLAIFIFNLIPNICSVCVA